jgi:hypothetical protein
MAPKGDSAAVFSVRASPSRINIFHSWDSADKGDIRPCHLAETLTGAFNVHQYQSVLDCAGEQASSFTFLFPSKIVITDHQTSFGSHFP